MSDLRKKYKKQKPKIADLKAQAEAEEKYMSNFNREDYHEIEEGKTNKFRFFQAHTAGMPFAIMRKRYWIKVPNEEGELKNKIVNDSVVHGGTKFDLVQEYVKLSAELIKDPKKLELINHWREGLKANIDWVLYALKLVKSEREFGLLSYDRRVRDLLNKECFVEDDDEPIETDPFTDVDDGYPVLITKNKVKKKGQKKETTEFGVSTAKKPDQLTDEELEIFEAAKPLEELYRGYTIKDFEKALETLEAFDEHNEIDLFSEDRWEEIVAKVRAQYGDEEDDDDEDEDEKPAKKSSKKPEVKKSSKKVVEDDDDEDEEEEEKPKKKPTKKPVKPEPEDDEDEDDEEEEETPKKSSKKPAAKKPAKDEDEDEDEDADDEDEDDTPKLKGKSKMTVADIKAKLKSKGK